MASWSPAPQRSASASGSSASERHSPPAQFFLPRSSSPSPGSSLKGGAGRFLERLGSSPLQIPSFPGRALLELDYAGLTQVMERDELEADRSAHDVWQAVEALEQGDPLAAVAYYGALQVRWGPLQARAHAS